MITEEVLKEQVEKDIDNTNKFTSEKIDKIITALVAATLEMTAPNKSQTGNRGAYSNLEDYLNCSKKTLANHGIFLHQHPRYEGKNRIMHSTLMHTSGQWLDSTDLVNPDPKLVDKSITFQQAISAVFTYAKRRMIQSQLGLGCDSED